MGVWDIYASRIKFHGETQRDEVLSREQWLLRDRLKNSLSYHSVSIDGISRTVAVINSDNLDEKTMISLPGENFTCGSIVDWADNHWLISEKDANTEVYTKVKLRQCNYLLKWVDDEDIIHEQWCVIEDGTKYLTGEYEDRNFVVTRGDSRIAMHIGRNQDTVKFERDNRFIIDDPDSKTKLAYLLTKPLKVGKYYNQEGIYSFVLQEIVATDNDNMELSIADYYKHFPKSEKIVEMSPSYKDKYSPPVEGKKVWL